MLTVKENLISILETFCPDNVYLQGTLNPDEAYPDTFITFYIMDSNFDSFYDDDANKIDWDVAVMIYSVDPETISSLSISIIQAAKAAGFIPQGAGYDIPIGIGIASHTGWALDFIYQQYKGD